MKPHFFPLLLLPMSTTTLFPLSPPAAAAPPPPSPAISNLGFGYAVALALGFLVILSTLLLSSYVCCRRRHHHRQPRSSAAADGSVILPRTIFIAEGDDDDDDPENPDRPSSSPGVVGLDHSIINSYPKFPFSNSGDISGDGTCSICLCDYRESEMLRMMPDCKHSFHLLCLDAWLRLNGSCPVCRNSPLPTPLSTPLAEVVPLAHYADNRRRRS